MRVGVVECDPGIRGLLVDSLNVYNHTPVCMETHTTTDGIDLIIVHPAQNRSQDAQVRTWHQQDIPVIILSFFDSRDHLLAEEMAAPIFYMPLNVRELMEKVWDTIIRAQYEHVRGAPALMCLAVQ